MDRSSYLLILSVKKLYAHWTNPPCLSPFTDRGRDNPVFCGGSRRGSGIAAGAADQAEFRQGVRSGPVDAGAARQPAAKLQQRTADPRGQTPCGDGGRDGGRGEPDFAGIRSTPPGAETGTRPPAAGGCGKNSRLLPPDAARKAGKSLALLMSDEGGRAAFDNAVNTATNVLSPQDRELLGPTFKTWKKMLEKPR